MYSIGILIYNGVEVLDFCGPYEVFRNLSNFNSDKQKINVFTIAETEEVVNAQGLRIIPDYSFANCPKLNILLVPGGSGKWLMGYKPILEFIEKQFKEVEYLLSVCTGAMPLGVLGLLDNIEATTHHEFLELLQETAPKSKIVSKRRFVDSGSIITGGGISAGIDLSFHVVEKLWGKNMADKIAIYMEYKK